MTDPDKAREGDPLVSRRYRELGAQVPPPAVDEAILAAARRAVDSHPAPLVAPVARRRWYFPLAAAAVIVLSVGVTLRMQLEQPKLDLPVQAPPPVAARKVEEAKVAQERVAEAKLADAAPASQPKAAEPASPRPFPAEPASAERRAAASAAPQATRRAMEREADTPARELERIALMRRRGHHADADKALAEFRKRHPEYKISKAMLERVERR